MSDYELASQWLALSAEARGTSKHLLIVLEPQQHYHSAIARDRSEVCKHCDLPWPIRMVTWRRLADAFRRVGADMRLNPGTRRWALGVHGFLRREDPRALGGWRELGLADVTESTWRFARRLVSPPDEQAPPAWRFNENWFATQRAVAPTLWSFIK